ncbi:hypothetical protein LWI29_024279 [Acer saccharum]|uniref:Uncharacterized protein n=1 Tax=Acer saccharum TaxID=4024 RepID=A0AA39VLH1_ACESA|nr:hypothetical protein LWI29_024279 [Acer saccharum]
MPISLLALSTPRMVPGADSAGPVATTGPEIMYSTSPPKLEEHNSQMEGKLLEDDDMSDLVVGGASGCHGSLRAEEQSAPVRILSSARSHYNC